MEEKRSKLSVIIKVLMFILFGGIILILCVVTDGIFDGSDLFAEFFGRKKDKDKQE